MKLIDKLEQINNSMADLRDRIENAKTVEELNNFNDELNTLKLEKEDIVNKMNEEGDKQMKNYLETEQASLDFATIQMNSKTKTEARQAWTNKLVENGISVSDKDNYLPKKLELELQTILTRSNPIFPLFKVTNIGAMLIARDLTSTDEAQVHIPGTTKVKQTATLKVSGIKPRMVYKAQSINEIDRRTIDNFGELYDTIVAELAQRVIDKVVDLALIEGSATDGETGSPQNENGFISIMNETNTNKVIKVKGKADIVVGIEEAVDAIDAIGKKYLIVTKAQKRQILSAVRAKFPQTTFFNNNKDIADTFGVDEIIIYNGVKEIQPIVMVEGAYSIDMQPLNRIEQFKFDTNENDILVETPATGRPVVFGGIAVVDTTK